MAFHVACPFTCRRICDCELGFGAAPGREALAAEIDALEEFLRDPGAVRPAADEEEASIVEALGEAANSFDGEYQGNSTVKVMCRICFSGEDEGTEKALKMLSCKQCNKKYHRSCLKTLSEHRGPYPLLHAALGALSLQY